MLFSGRTGRERLDQPLSNFDVIGVPTGAWDSSLFQFYRNLIPSCLVSFLCPCVMWGQIVVRAQIPLLIGIKNSFPWFRRTTGYGAFVDFFFWSLVLAIVFLTIASLISNIPKFLKYILYIAAILLVLMFIYLVGHTRTAFREKYNFLLIYNFLLTNFSARYQLPGCFPRGCEVWSMLVDHVIAIVCLPCSLSQVILFRCFLSVPESFYRWHVTYFNMKEVNRKSACFSVIHR